MNGDLVIAADFGTSGVKVGVVDAELRLISQVVETYPLYLAPGGHAEQVPSEMWSALVLAIAALHRNLPKLRERAGAIVFCGQACGVICVDKEGNPLRPCLTWMDKRGAKISNRLVGGFPNVRGYRIDKGLLWLALANGAPAQNGMDPTAKILWIKENEPEVFNKTRWFLDVRDWLVHRATGVFTTTPESANLTWIMNTRKGHEGWSEILSRIAGIPTEKLPPIVQGEDVIDCLTVSAAAELGLNKNVKLVGGASDVTAATLGTGEVEDGALHISLATSAWIAGFFPSRRVSISHAFATITSSLNYRPLLIASQENAGSALEWVAKITNANVESGFSKNGIPQIDDPYFMPWLAGERVPVDDRNLRGSFHGLALHHDKNALRRAAMEGVALNLRWGLEKVRQVRGVQSKRPLTLVGGVAANTEFTQLLSDTLNQELHVGAARHTGVLGAAVLAAKTMGWASDACNCAVRLKGRTQAVYYPDPSRATFREDRARRLNKMRGDIMRSYKHK
ncbi:xylulokinase [Pseudopelagicola sp. nBUS_19]|uniref:xylulokinase n=1 Tax=Pseudopelagicola sp. nBUS_19 TaxID=3395316 RepID=UPI003EC04200